MVFSLVLKVIYFINRILPRAVYSIGANKGRLGSVPKGLWSCDLISPNWDYDMWTCSGVCLLVLPKSTEVPLASASALDYDVCTVFMYPSLTESK